MNLLSNIDALHIHYRYHFLQLTCYEDKKRMILCFHCRAILDIILTAFISTLQHAKSTLQRVNIVTTHSYQGVPSVSAEQWIWNGFIHNESSELRQRLKHTVGTCRKAWPLVWKCLPMYCLRRMETMLTCHCIVKWEKILSLLFISSQCGHINTTLWSFINHRIYQFVFSVQRAFLHSVLFTVCPPAHLQYDVGWIPGGVQDWWWRWGWWGNEFISVPTPPTTTPVFLFLHPLRYPSAISLACWSQRPLRSQQAPEGKDHDML